jgi:hypothetical protein
MVSVDYPFPDAVHREARISDCRTSEVNSAVPEWRMCKRDRNEGSGRLPAPDPLLARGRPPD